MTTERARELEFRVTVFVDDEKEAVRIADEWRLCMTAATDAWANCRDFVKREVEA